MSLEEYRKEITEYLIKNMDFSVEITERELVKYGKIIEDCYKKKWKITSVATMIANEL